MPQPRTRGYVGLVADALPGNPRLAALYDPFDPDRNLFDPDPLRRFRWMAGEML